MGLPSLRTCSPLCSYGTVRHKGLRAVCLGWGRPWSPIGTDQRTEMQQAATDPPPWPRFSCAPTEVPETAPTPTLPPTQAQCLHTKHLLLAQWQPARFFEGQFGTEPQTSPFQNRILACPLVKFLHSACFCCCCCCCLKRNTKEGERMFHTELGCG